MRTFVSLAWRRPVACLMILAAGGLLGTLAYGGVGLIQAGAVGGVKIDADGVLTNSTTTDRRELQQAWQAGLEKIAANLDDPAELRFVSLKALEAEIARRREALEPLPDEIKFLAGLQRVRYVLVYPERGDIVLAGPAEGWRVDSLGSIVGATTGRPVLLLDDWIVALRSANDSGQTGISCSIDPTPEGLERAQRLQRELRAGMSPEVAAEKLEEALGDQVITVTGVPQTSHFARMMVAADFRMKRLAMHFEPAPVDGLPSYLEMAKGSRSHSANLLPRWWLAPHYQPLARDEAGLAWEIRGQGVKCLTEQDFVAESGQVQHTGRAEPIAKKWAEAFTAQFAELAREDSTFGHLRNVMDLAVVAALIAKEDLLGKVGLELPQLMHEEVVYSLNAPRRVASQASFVRQRGGWLISASGGVRMDPWYTADQTEVAAHLTAMHDRVAVGDSAEWWWNAAE